MKKAAISGEDYNLTSGEQVRDFTPVEEVAKQLVDNLQFFEGIKLIDQFSLEL